MSQRPTSLFLPLRLEDGSAPLEAEASDRARGRFESDVAPVSLTFLSLLALDLSHRPFLEVRSMASLL